MAGSFRQLAHETSPADVLCTVDGVDAPTEAEARIATQVPRDLQDEERQEAGVGEAERACLEQRLSSCFWQGSGEVLQRAHISVFD